MLFNGALSDTTDPMGGVPSQTSMEAEMDRLLQPSEDSQS